VGGRPRNDYIPLTLLPQNERHSTEWAQVSHRYDKAAEGSGPSICRNESSFVRLSPGSFACLVWSSVSWPRSERLFAPFARYLPSCSLPGNIGFGENQLQRQACGVEGPETSMTGDITTRRINNRTAWTAAEDERLRQLVISNASPSEIAEDLGRTASAVRARPMQNELPLGARDL
jgi:hypothetical protein